MIDQSISQHIGVITIDRPEKRNAMTRSMLVAFLAAVSSLAADRSVRAIVVTGTGGAFCAGTDLTDLGGSDDPVLRSRPPTAADRWPLFAAAVPTIAAIDGPAVGMGAEIAMQCDVRVLGPGARLSWNFASRGLVPDMGVSTWLLPRVVGLQEAARLLYGGRTVDAAEGVALGLGLAADDALAVALAEASSFAAGGPAAVAASKALLHGALSGDLSSHLQAHDAAMAACFAGPELAEGVAAFQEKRAPRFPDR